MNDKEDYAGLIERLKQDAEYRRINPDSGYSRAEIEAGDETANLELEAASALTTLTQDAKRYQFLKPLYSCVDFEYWYGSEGRNIPSIVFTIPPDTRWSGDLDASIDAAMEGKADGK